MKLPKPLNFLKRESNLSNSGSNDSKSRIKNRKAQSKGKSLFVPNQRGSQRNTLNFLKPKDQKLRLGDISNNLNNQNLFSKKNNSVADFISRPRYVSSLRRESSTSKNVNPRSQTQPVFNSGFNTSQDKGIIKVIKSKIRPNKKVEKLNLVKERKREIFKSNLKEINIQIPFKIILAVVILIFVISSLLFLNNSAFRVKEVNIIAPKEVIEEIQNYSDRFKDQNIYLLSEQNIAAEIKTIVPEIERVFLYKEFPDKILIEAVQGDPTLILASLDEVSLINIEGKIIGNFNIKDDLILTEVEKSILSGERDIENVFVQEKYLEGKSDEEKLLFNWADINSDEKNRIFDGIKLAVEQKVQAHYDSVVETYSKSIYSTLPLIQSNYINEMDAEDVNIATGLIDLLSVRGIELNKVFLSTKFTLDFYTKQGKLIKLSLRRELGQQVKELDTLIYDGLYARARIVDLRSDTYSITR